MAERVTDGVVRAALLLLAAMLIGTTMRAAPASAQTASAAEISKTLYNIIGAEKGSLSVRVDRLSGLGDKASRAESDANSKAWFAARGKLGRDASGLYCDGMFSGFKGSLYRLAIVAGDWQRLWELAQMGLDPNIVDPATGRNAVDDIAQAYDLQLRREEVVPKPWERLNPTVSSGDKPYRRASLGMLRAYATLREAGGRLSGEVPVRKPDCAAIPADKPAPGPAFDGQLAKQSVGPTPPVIPGVKTVSARQAACLLDLHGSKMLVMAVLRDPVAIPGSQDFAYAGSAGNFTDRAQFLVADDLYLFTNFGADKSRPLLVYCHHVRCWLSYNAVLRIKAAGYTNIHWLRSGLDAWTAAGFPTGGVTPSHKPLRPFENY